MSASLVGAVLKVGPEDRTQRFVMVAIADNADDYGFACPSEETIADMTVCNVRTVKRALQDLKEAAWLRIGARMLNRGKANVYFLNVEKLGVAPGLKSRKSPLHAELERRMEKKASANPKPEVKAAPVEDLQPDADVDDCSTCHKPFHAEDAPANPDAEVEVSGDTVSPEIVEGAKLSGDNPQGCQVTKTTLSGDKSCIPILKNHWEPLLNPNTTTPQPPLRGGAVDFESRKAGTATAANPHGNRSVNGNGGGPARMPGDAVDPNAAFEMALRVEAEAAMLECGVSNPRLLRVFVDAMRMQHKRERMSPAESRMMMVAGWGEWKEFCEGGNARHSIGPRKFIGEGYWLDKKLWPVDMAGIERERQRARASIGARYM